MPSLTCQRCNQPLRVDESLSDMDASSAELLLAPLSSEEQYKIKQQENINNTISNDNTNNIINYNVSRKYIHKQTSSQQRPVLPVSDSFVILSKSQVHPSALPNTTANNINISHRLKSATHSDSSLSKTAITKAGTVSTGLPTSPHKKLSNIIITKGDIGSNISTDSTDNSNNNNNNNNNIHNDNNKNNNNNGNNNGNNNNTMKINTPLTTPTIMEFPDNAHTGATGLEIPPSSPRNNNLSHRLKVANRLFDVMSSKSNVDHPMCQECTDLMLEYLERQLEDVGRERDCYLDFLKKMKHTLLPVNNNNNNNNNNIDSDDHDSSNSSNPNGEHQLKIEVDELMKKEKEAMELLESMKKEQTELEKKYDQLLLEEKQLAEEDENFWDESNSYQLQYQQFQNERDSVNLKYDHDVRSLERLKKTVVYNDAFFISQDGPFGTINGYRLGRLSSHPVEWNEINAAWGQTLLLLYTVANKLKFSFQSYRLVPMGSFSKVEKVDGDIVVAYELYGSGDYGLNRMLFLNRRFDHAMVAMLNCLKQLSDYVEQRDRSIRLPYRINKDKIGELSIRLQFNQDELWTKALKYLLINLRYIQAFTCKTTS